MRHTVIIVYIAYISVYTTVTFGPSNNRQLSHTVRLLLDTGSYVTWLATDNTQLNDVTVCKLIYIFVLIA